MGNKQAWYRKRLSCAFLLLEATPVLHQAEEVTCRSAPEVRLLSKEEFPSLRLHVYEPHSFSLYKDDYSDWTTDAASFVERHAYSAGRCEGLVLRNDEEDMEFLSFTQGAFPTDGHRSFDIIWETPVSTLLQMRYRLGPSCADFPITKRRLVQRQLLLPTSGNGC